MIIERRTFSSGIKDTAAAANDDRGVTAPPTPSSDHAPSNATDTPTYTPSSLVENGETTVLIASSLTTAAPVATSTVAAMAQTKPKATLTIPFVKLNTLLN